VRRQCRTNVSRPNQVRDQMRESAERENQTEAACERSTLVFTSTCEFAQDELLSQTADDMQTHIYPKSLEYMPGSTI